MLLRRKTPAAIGFTRSGPPVLGCREKLSGSSSSFMGCAKSLRRLAYSSKSKQRPARLQPSAGKVCAARAGVRLVFGLLRDLLVVRGQGIDEAVVGVQRVPGELLEDFLLLPYQLRQTPHRAAVELRMVLEGLHPVLEEPAREPHAALLNVESPVYGRPVRFAGEPVHLLGGVSALFLILLVHPISCPRTHMITPPAVHRLDLPLDTGRTGLLAWLVQRSDYRRGRGSLSDFERESGVVR